MEYSFKIQYCAEGAGKPEVMFECSFDAPDEDHADRFFDAICAQHGAIMPLQPLRIYEHVREWKRKAAIAK